MKLPKIQLNGRVVFYSVLVSALIYFGGRLVVRRSTQAIVAPVSKEQVLSECLRISNHVFPSKSIRQLSVNLALKMMREKQYGLAKKIYEEVLAAEPNNVGVLNNLAYVAGELAEWGSALQYLKTALQIDDGCSECHNNLGTVYFREGRQEDAEKEFLVAAKLNPKYLEPRVSLAVVAENKGDWERAWQWYKEAQVLATDPELLKNINQRQVWMAEIVGVNRVVAGVPQ